MAPISIVHISELHNEGSYNIDDWTKMYKQFEAFLSYFQTSRYTDYLCTTHSLTNCLEYYTKQ